MYQSGTSLSQLAGLLLWSIRNAPFLRNEDSYVATRACGKLPNQKKKMVIQKTGLKVHYRCCGSLTFMGEIWKCFYSNWSTLSWMPITANYEDASKLFYICVRPDCFFLLLHIICSTNPLALLFLAASKILQSITWAIHITFFLSLEDNLVFNQRPLDKRK